MIVYKDAAYPIHYHKRVIRDTKGREHPVPSIVVLKEYHKFNGGLARCTLRNVHIRDMFTCQYCGNEFDKKHLSVDHVIPRSQWRQCGHKGSPTTFSNVVTSCKACNTYKGDRPLGVATYPHRVRERWLQHLAGAKHALSKEPKAITYAELLRRQIQSMCKPYPEQWDEYVKGTR